MKFKTLLTLLAVIAAYAYGIPAFASAEGFRNLTTSEGLPGNTVGAIEKDSLGFIWIGTKFGLGRFDGHAVKAYSALDGVDIWSIEELDADTLLIGTVSGLCHFSRRTNTATRLDLPPTIVKSIRKIDGRRFLAGTETGLYLVDGHTPHQILLETGLSSCNHITSIIREDDHIYWFSTADGLGRLDLRTLKADLYRMEEGLDNTNFFICLTRVGDHIYIGSFNKGVFRFDLSSRKFSPVKGFEHNLILTLDGEGDRLFVGTNGQGLKVLSLADGSIRTFAHDKKVKNSISSNTVTAFLYDRGIEWIGTQFGGINYTLPGVDGGQFFYYNWRDFYSTDYRVRCFYIFPDGDKLIGTRTGLFYISERKGIMRRYRMEDPASGLRSDIILSIHPVKDRVLVATFGGGIHVFDKASLQLKDLSREEPFLYGCFFHFTQDRVGNLWIASQEGIYQSTLDGHILRKYDTLNSELKVNVVYLYPDGLNRLWIGTKFGLFLLDINTGKLRSDCFSVPIKNEVKYIMEDSRNRMWICAEDGLYQVNQDLQVTAHFTADNLLPDNMVNSIQEDRLGNYWIATRKSIVKYSPATHTHYTYHKQNGLNDQDFNNGVVMSADSILWWPNEGGLIYTSAKESPTVGRQNTNPVLTTCIAAGTEYDLPYQDVKEITLPQSDNRIRFCFSCLDYSMPYTHTFEYKLEGYDTDWIRQTGIHEARYEHLPSGNYTFRLRSPEAGDGEEQQIAVTVDRSYTFFLVTSVVIVLIAVLVIYFCYRIWKLKKRMTNERLILSSVHDQGKAKKPVLPETKANDLLENLLAYMDREKPYLNAKLNIGDVVTALNCTEPDLSQLLNSHLHVNFANFVNTYRVNEIKRRLNQENLSRYTLSSLSEQCGFSSKATFYRVFKNITGMTPLEYCKSQHLAVKES